VNNLQIFYDKYPNFNWRFYLSFYRDLSKVFNTEYEAILHYINHGKKEGRIYSSIELQKNQEYVNNLVNNLYVEQKKLTDSYYQNFTILIRTNQRPNSFRRCYDSIISQEYPIENININVSYHNQETYSYLSLYQDITAIKIEETNIKPNSSNLYPYNIYLNNLLANVSMNSWIIIIDDDDLFVNKYSLSTINNEINTILNIKKKIDFTLHWRVWRCDKLVGEKGFNSGICDPDVALCGFAFHSSQLNHIHFDTSRVSFTINKFCSKYNIYWTKYIITKIGQHNELAGYGIPEQTATIPI
jgi:hypothetical protein